jgi:hypothetical protein
MISYAAWTRTVDNVFMPLLFGSIGIILCKVLNVGWRWVLKRRLHIQLNEIWRQEHEEAEPDERFTDISAEGQSLRRLRNTTVASQPLTPAPSSQVPPAFQQPPVPLLPYPRRTTSQPTLNIGAPV